MEARATRRSMAERAEEMFREEIRARRASTESLEAETSRAGEKHGQDMRTAALERRNLMRGAPLDRAGKRAEIDDLYAARQQSEQQARVAELAGEREGWRADDAAALERDRFGLDQRKQTEVERRNLAGEAFDRFKSAQIDPNVIMSALAMLSDPDIPPEQKQRVAQGMLALIARSRATGGAPGPAGPAPAGGAPGPAAAGGGGGDLSALFRSATGEQSTVTEVTQRLSTLMPEITEASKVGGPEEVRTFLQRKFPGVPPAVLRKAMAGLMRGEAGEAYGQAMKPEPEGGFVYNLANTVNDFVNPENAVDYESLQRGARDRLVGLTDPTPGRADQRGPVEFPAPPTTFVPPAAAGGRGGPQRSPGYEQWNLDNLRAMMRRPVASTPDTARAEPFGPPPAAPAPQGGLEHLTPPPKLARYQIRQIKGARNRKDRETLLTKFGVPPKFWIHFGPDMDEWDPMVNADVAR